MYQYLKLILFAVFFMSVGCYSSVYYKVHRIGTIAPGFRFELLSLSDDVKMLNDTTKLHSILHSTQDMHVERAKKLKVLSPLVSNQNNTYWRLMIYYEYENNTLKELTFDINNLKIYIKEPKQQLVFNGYKIIKQLPNINNIQRYRITTEPIGVPIKYNGNIDIKFDIVVSNPILGRILVDQEIELTFVKKMHRYLSGT